MFQRGGGELLGIAEQVLPKCRFVGNGERVGAVVARGELEIGFQQLSELLPVKGIDHITPLPPELQKVSSFAAGVAATSPDKGRARAAIEFLASKEAVTVPPTHAAEMVPFNPLVGEFRVHYAGFFDPGFGYAAAGGTGSKAVLEVRSHKVPFILEHGQMIGRLVYERLTEAPDKLYGRDIGSHYQAQGLKLSKHFRVG